MTSAVQVRFNGRFGNNMFQYAFGRSLSEQFGIQLQTDPWIGEKIFSGVVCNPIGRVEDSILVDGFWQDTRYMANLSRKRAKDYFQIRTEFKIKPWMNVPYVAIHIRSGDVSGRKERATPSMDSFVHAISYYGLGRFPVVTVTEDSEHNSNHLPDDIVFMEDFQILMNASFLFRSASSFSWWAGALGNGEVYSPDVSGLSGNVRCLFKNGNDNGIVSLIGSPKIILK